MQEKQYDKKHAKLNAFIVGAKVLNKDMTRKKRVVDTCFVGPYCQGR